MGIYAVKRLGRLYPEYIGCILFSVLLIGPLFTQYTWSEYWGYREQIGWYITWNLRMFPNYGLPGVFANNIYPNTVNGSFWTMPVEIALYILVLAVFLISKSEKKRKIVYAIVTILITIGFLVQIIFFPYEYKVWYGTDWLQAIDVMPYFLIGGFAYLFDWKKYANVQLSAALLLIFAGSLTVTTLYINEIICLIFLPYFVLSSYKSKPCILEINFISLNSVLR